MINIARSVKTLTYLCAHEQRNFRRFCGCEEQVSVKRGKGGLFYQSLREIIPGYSGVFL
jgi:hypothetical protein